MTSQTLISERLPSLEEYLALVEAVGWQSYVTPETATIALANSLFGVVAENDTLGAVGMGRIIGDSGLFFYVQDVAVAPRCQAQGVGAAIMDALMAYLDANAPDRSFVGLFSASGKAPFYERYGFRAAEPERPGMQLTIRMPG